jgi:DNA repair protein RecO (recombination protein O)
MRANLQAGYVLHTRAWRDNSLLVEYFSRELGRVSLVAKGAKSRKNRGGSGAALLQPFTPLQCSWSGRGQLRTLTGCESMGPGLPLPGRRLYSGLYMNELLARLLHHDDPHRKLFDHYAAVLTLLSAGEGEEESLRRFELVLLEELGYGFDLGCDGRSGEAFDESRWYHFHEEHGLVLAPDGGSERLPRYRGADLLSIGRGDFSGSARLCAKRLMRQALSAHLGDRPLKSRELFRQLDER